MDPARIIVRVLFAWTFALILVRVSGKRTIKQGDLASFAVALILGDLFDDVFWSEVPASEFIVAAGTLVVLHALVSVDAFKRGARQWRRSRFEAA
jgi:uncharacterized membrane protein YcaP (DUF421 family)